MVRLVTRAVAIVAVLLTVGGAKAFAQMLDNKEESRRAYYQSVFVGWHGVMFTCLYQKENDFTRRLCDAAKQDALFLAAAAQVPFKAVIGDNDYNISFDAGIIVHKFQNALTLKAVFSASSKSGLAGVRFGLNAGNHASKYVAQDGQKSERIPRPGTLVMWSKNSIASGVIGTELERAVRNAMETSLKDFFSSFLEHWNQPRTGATTSP